MCLIENCKTEKNKGRGLCDKHYTQYMAGKLQGNFPKLSLTGDITKSLKDLPISYRQLDYWIRSGKVVIKGNVSGSGHRRTLTDKEKETLRQLVEIKNNVAKIEEAFSNGDLWRLLYANAK